MGHDVFISYSSEDKLVADAVCAIFEQEGIKCWIAPRDVQVGRNYSGEITRAIKNCKVFVLIYSPTSNNSQYVLSETNSAFKKEIPIVSLCIKNEKFNDDIEFFLKNSQRRNALTPVCENHIKDLAADVKRLLMEMGKEKFDQIKSDAYIHPVIRENCCIKTGPSKICLNCGKSNPEYYDYCKNCGEPTDLKNKNQNKENKRCPNPYCENENNPQDALYCFKCGYSFKDKNDQEKSFIKRIKDTIPKRKIKISLKLTISFLFLVAVGTFFLSNGLYVQHNNMSGNTTDFIKITDPINGSTVPSNYTVRGTASQNASSDKLYLLIQPQPLNGDGPFEWWAYEPTVNSDGTWECNVQIGVANGDIGRSFNICVISTDEKLQVGQVGYSLPKNNQKYEITVKRQ